MAETHGVRRGQDVYGSDGGKLGRVLQCDESGFVVEKGIVFTQDRRVGYGEVASATAHEVRLSVPADALLPEQEAEPWNPRRDPEGTAGGVDIEPLRAGMAEIDEEQHVPSAPHGQPGPARPRQGAREWRGAVGREVQPGMAPATPRGGGADRGGPRTRSARVQDAELSRHIGEEVEDYEREAGCAPRGPPRIPRSSEVVAGADGGGRSPAARRRRAASKPAAPPARPARPIDLGSAAPEAMAAMRRLEAYVRRCGLEPALLELVRVRASQLNGCAYCIDMHTKDARRAGETEQRLYALAAWRETPFFTDRERAALAWTEAVTRVGVDRVEDEIYRLARDRFSDRELVDLTMAVVTINGWNRLAIAFRTEPGSYQPTAR